MVIKCFTEAGNVTVTEDTEATAKQPLLTTVDDNKLAGHPTHDGLRHCQLNGVV